MDLVEYNCVEQLMMASKARLFSDDAALSAILASDDPRGVQRLGGRGCNKFVPVLGGDGTKTVPPGDLFDQPPGEMS